MTRNDVSSEEVGYACRLEFDINNARSPEPLGREAIRALTSTAFGAVVELTAEGDIP